MNRHEMAIKLLKQPEGATVETLTKRLKLKNPKQARGVIDRLRAKDEKVINNAPNTFKIRTRKVRRNPRSA